ncbi:hypothetical protein BESB_004470 [Besnoitia besnoiti]|uniref:Apple domain-containing protein n=1 Tax=Besnoitia besnoiti TaxID=94643 RepID=A0A2A9MP64_BESBE|nr:hypothetical protein BESB_004470 [Besnoitia besnoiti]PFH38106.1 hypothetical protein BESB_004470 [Besnoitia besnoiti]
MVRRNWNGFCRNTSLAWRRDGRRMQDEGTGWPVSPRGGWPRWLLLLCSTIFLSTLAVAETRTFSGQQSEERTQPGASVDQDPASSLERMGRSPQMLQVEAEGGHTTPTSDFLSESFSSEKNTLRHEGDGSDSAATHTSVTRESEHQPAEGTTGRQVDGIEQRQTRNLTLERQRVSDTSIDVMARNGPSNDSKAHEKAPTTEQSGSADEQETEDVFTSQKAGMSQAPMPEGWRQTVKLGAESVAEGTTGKAPQVAQASHEETTDRATASAGTMEETSTPFISAPRGTQPLSSVGAGKRHEHAVVRPGPGDVGGATMSSAGDDQRALGTRPGLLPTAYIHGAEEVSHTVFASGKVSDSVLSPAPSVEAGVADIYAAPSLYTNPAGEQEEFARRSQGSVGTAHDRRKGADRLRNCHTTAGREVPFKVKSNDDSRSTTIRQADAAHPRKTRRRALPEHPRKAEIYLQAATGQREKPTVHHRKTSETPLNRKPRRVGTQHKQVSATQRSGRRQEGEGPSPAVPLSLQLVRKNPAVTAEAMADARATTAASASESAQIPHNRSKPGRQEGVAAMTAESTPRGSHAAGNRVDSGTAAVSIASPPVNTTSKTLAPGSYASERSGTAAKQTTASGSSLREVRHAEGASSTTQMQDHRANLQEAVSATKPPDPIRERHSRGPSAALRTRERTPPGQRLATGVSPVDSNRGLSRQQQDKQLEDLTKRGLQPRGRDEQVLKQVSESTGRLSVWKRLLRKEKKHDDRKNKEHKRGSRQKASQHVVERQRKMARKQATRYPKYPCKTQKTKHSSEQKKNSRAAQSLETRSTPDNAGSEPRRAPSSGKKEAQERTSGSLPAMPPDRLGASQNTDIDERVDDVALFLSEMKELLRSLGKKETVEQTREGLPDAFPQIRAREEERRTQKTSTDAQKTKALVTKEHVHVDGDQEEANEDLTDLKDRDIPRRGWKHPEPHRADSRGKRTVPEKPVEAGTMWMPRRAQKPLLQVDDSCFERNVRYSPGNEFLVVWRGVPTATHCQALCRFAATECRFFSYVRSALLPAEHQGACYLLPRKAPVVRLPSQGVFEVISGTRTCSPPTPDKPPMDLVGVTKQTGCPSSPSVCDGLHVPYPLGSRFSPLCADSKEGQCSSLAVGVPCCTTCNDYPENACPEDDCYEFNVDYTDGRELRHVGAGIGSRGACESLCRETGRCTHYSYFASHLLPHRIRGSCSLREFTSTPRDRVTIGGLERSIDGGHATSARSSVIFAPLSCRLPKTTTTTTTTAAPPLHETLCTRENTDFWGHDLASFKSCSSSVACQQICKTVDGCVGFTYVPLKKKCHLKWSTAMETYVEGHESGPRCCPPQFPDEAIDDGSVDGEAGGLCPPARDTPCLFPGRDYPGNDIDYREGVVSAYKCYHICREMLECDIWTHLPGERLCFLKQADSPSEPTRPPHRQELVEGMTQVIGSITGFADCEPVYGPDAGNFILPPARKTAEALRAPTASSQAAGDLRAPSDVSAENDQDGQEEASQPPGNDDSTQEDTEEDHVALLGSVAEESSEEDDSSDSESRSSAESDTSFPVDEPSDDGLF